MAILGDLEMKTEIARRWSIGESLKQIALALGVTRSTIAGKISRMRQHGADIAKREPAIKVGQSPRPQKITRIIHAPTQRRPVRPAVKISEGVIITIVELQHYHCRAVMDGQKNGLPIYCGKLRREDAPYCEEHYRRYTGGRLR